MSTPTENDRARARVLVMTYTFTPTRGDLMTETAMEAAAVGIAAERARIVEALRAAEAHGREHVRDWDGKLKVETIIAAVEDGTL